ncbi:phage baseplate protein [Faecalicoccus pleomorphus]|uniref:phage baseplate protein n=1 Tax=Faecalicoccus pleomorphus TaxID=1323 RepID=UPI003A5238FA
MSFTAGQIVGEYKHHLSLDEMPSHTHGQHVTTPTGNGNAIRSDYVGDANNGSLYSQGVATGATGGSQSHNNIQPSMVCCIFRRTA